MPTTSVPFCGPPDRASSLLRRESAASRAPPRPRRREPERDLPRRSRPRRSLSSERPARDLRGERERDRERDRERCELPRRRDDRRLRLGLREWRRFRDERLRSLLEREELDEGLLLRDEPELEPEEDAELERELERDFERSRRLRPREERSFVSRSFPLSGAGSAAGASLAGGAGSALRAWSEPSAGAWAPSAALIALFSRLGPRTAGAGSTERWDGRG